MGLSRLPRVVRRSLSTHRGHPWRVATLKGDMSGRRWPGGNRSVAGGTIGLDDLVLDAAAGRDGQAVGRGPRADCGGIDTVEGRLTGLRCRATTAARLRRLVRHGLCPVRFLGLLIRCTGPGEPS